VGPRPLPPAAINEWMRATAQKQQQDYQQRQHGGRQAGQRGAGVAARGRRGGGRHTGAAGGRGRTKPLEQLQLAADEENVNVDDFWHQSPLARLQAEAEAASNRVLYSSSAHAAQGHHQASTAAAAVRAAAPKVVETPVATAAALWSQTGASALQAIATTLTSSPSRSVVQPARIHPQPQAPTAAAAAATAGGNGPSAPGGGNVGEVGQQSGQKRPFSDASPTDQTRSRKPKKPRQLPSGVPLGRPPPASSSSAAAAHCPVMGAAWEGDGPPASASSSLGKIQYSRTAETRACDDKSAAVSGSMFTASEASPSLLSPMPRPLLDSGGGLLYVQGHSAGAAPGASLPASASLQQALIEDVLSEPLVLKGTGAAAGPGNLSVGVGPHVMEGGAAASSTTPTRAAQIPIAVLPWRTGA
jgi:hypothetical protein